MTEEQRFRLAAKACGKDLTGWEWFDSAECFHRRAYGLIYERWNPRDDDGDSRRLQVDCRMTIEYFGAGPGTYPTVVAGAAGKGFGECGFESDEGLHAATRLAVLNCAVDTGRRWDD